MSKCKTTPKAYRLKNTDFNGRASKPKATDRIRSAALAFALADYRWQILSIEADRWTDPDGLRTLAAVFLQYHAAKLALEALPTDSALAVSPLPQTSRLAA